MEADGVLKSMADYPVLQKTMPGKINKVHQTRPMIQSVD
jgi:hypothetical protein